MVNESIQEQNQISKNERMKLFEDDEEVIGDGLVKIFTPSKSCMVQIRALPLPGEVTDVLENNQFLIKTLDQYVSAHISEKAKLRSHQMSKLKDSMKEDIKEFKDKLVKAFSSAGKKWRDCVDKIWAFGPRRVGPNLLLNKVEGYDRISFWNCTESDKSVKKYSVRDYDYSILSGFQLATLTGPLCDEPLRGVCFIIEKWEVNETNDTELNTQTDIGLGSKEAVSSLDIHLGNMQLEESKSVECQGPSVSCDKEISSFSQSEDTSCQTYDVETSENIELNESCDNILPIVSKRKRQRSYKVSESGSIHDLDIEKSNDLDLDSSSDAGSEFSGKKIESHGHLSGQLISIVKDGCRKAFQTQPQRLMAAMYKCTIQCTTEALGKSCFHV